MNIPINPSAPWTKKLKTAMEMSYRSSVKRREAYGPDVRSRAQERPAPPMQRCACGREHWHPGGRSECVSCELARHMKGR